VQASNTAGKADTEGAMKIVHSPPTFKNGGLEPSYEFMEDLLLSVDIDGSPLPVVTWMKDGNPLDPTINQRVTITTGYAERALRVTSVDPTDEGMYSVSLKNATGAAESNTYVFIICKSTSYNEEGESYYFWHCD